MDGKKRKKPHGGDCGCDAAYGTDDGDYAAEQPGTFAAEVFATYAAEIAQVDDVAEAGPDPRGTQVKRWRGLIAPFVEPTGDGRRFALGGLTARELPFGVKWQREDNQGHTTSVLVGRVDGVDFHEDGDDPRVEAWGIVFDPDPDVTPRWAEDCNEAWGLLEKKVIGPSVDLDALAYHPVPAADGSEFAANGQQEIEVTKGRISAITLVPIPAFSQARPFALDMIDASEYAEMTAVTAAGVAEGMEALPVADGFAWDPAQWVADGMRPETALYASGGIVAFPVATLTASGGLQLVPDAIADAVSVLAYHADEIELGEGTKQVLRYQLEELTAAAHLPVPPWAMTSLVASAPVAPVELFKNPHFKEPTPVRIREVDGMLHYAGHVATWGVCHIGYPGQCVTAPRSKANYAYFHVGSTETTEGRIATGKISLGGGHADLRQGFQAAVEHYDTVSTAAVDVRAGEDDWGIWVSGVVRPSIDAERLAELASAPLSGDWRRVGGGMEFVAALAVNTPGFPVPHINKAQGDTYALVAAGVVPLDDEALPAPAPRNLRPTAATFDVDTFAELDARQGRLASAKLFA